MDNAKLTQEELQAIKERAEKAPDAPWKVVPLMWDGDFAVDDRLGWRVCTIATGGKQDAEFIANARQDIPRLVSEVERLREALEFYANKANYEAKYSMDLDGFSVVKRRITDDNGIIAREALE